ncbi:MAG: GNAT family N-acetyltransferase [Akkermansiaceae bacterium]|nr:GNAT family N-acetyltransferase [Armatimonadota bacterium]
MRKPTSADAMPVARVLVQTFLSAHKGQIPEEVWQWRQREWTAEFMSGIWERMLGEISSGNRSRESAYVAETASGQIIGIVKAEPADDANGGLIGEVTALYVDTEHQGRGVGRRLLVAIAEDQAAKGFTGLQVGTLITNTPARLFYEAMGGQLAAERDIEDGGHPLREVIYRWHDIKRVGQAQKNCS